MNIFQILMASNSEAEKHLAEARKILEKVFPNGIRFSEQLVSMAVDNQGFEEPQTTAYLNALCLAYSELPMDSVQSILKGVETKMGRVRGVEGKGVIAIDLDLVVWNEAILRPRDVARTYYQNCLLSLRKHESTL